MVAQGFHIIITFSTCFNITTTYDIGEPRQAWWWDLCLTRSFVRKKVPTKHWKAQNIGRVVRAFHGWPRIPGTKIWTYFLGPCDLARRTPTWWAELWGRTRWRPTRTPTPTKSHREYNLQLTKWQLLLHFYSTRKRGRSWDRCQVHKTYLAPFYWSLNLNISTKLIGIVFRQISMTLDKVEKKRMNKNSWSNVDTGDENYKWQISFTKK